MGTSVYDIRRPGWGDLFKLHISFDAAEMCAKVRRMAAKLNYSNTEGDLEAIVLPIYTILSDGIIAHMFLNQDNLTHGIIAHECLHVGMARERFLLRFGMDYGDGLTPLDNEERLAYYVGDIVELVTECLTGHQFRIKRV